MCDTDPTLGSDHQIYRLLDVFCPIQLNIMPSDSVYYSYVANLAYLKSSEIVEARILAQYSRIFEYLYSFEYEYSRVSNTRIFVDTREYYISILVRMRVLIS